MKKRLCKSNKFRMVCGVCGGWAELLNWDPTIIRLLFIILSFFKGIGIFLYLVLAFIMPSPISIDSSENDENPADEKIVETSKKNTVKKSNKQSKKNAEIHTDKEFNAFFDQKK